MPVLTDMLAFRQHNLMEPLHERPFDLVLPEECANLF